MSIDIQSTHSLLAGQAKHLRLACGDAVVVTRGTVRLRASPQWLAGQMLAASCTLEEGEHQLIEASGWVVLEAGSGEAGVCVLARQAAGAVRRNWAPAWWRRLVF